LRYVDDDFRAIRRWHKVTVIDLQRLAGLEAVGCFQSICFGKNTRINTKSRADTRKRVSGLNRVHELTTDDLRKKHENWNKHSHCSTSRVSDSALIVVSLLEEVDLGRAAPHHVLHASHQFVWQNRWRDYDRHAA
jgi:hypothetical protein